MRTNTTAVTDSSVPLFEVNGQIMPAKAAHCELPNPTICWSCGGGTQSVAIAALIVQGRLPRPDIAVMIDTEREVTETWDYAASVLLPNLRAAGVELVIVKKSDFATVNVWGGADGKTVLMPMFTTQTDKPGGVGKLPTYCSIEWKRRVYERYLRSVGVKQATTWIGFSLDEMRRIPKPVAGWNQPRYPLIQDVPMRRAGCVHLIESVMGWPRAPRSRCKDCPNQSEPDWRDLHDNHPADFAAAVAFDIEARLTDPNIFVHSSGIPLGEVDFSERPHVPGLFDEEFAGQDEKGCSSGYCFV